MSLYYQDDHVTLYHGDCLTEHREWLEADVLVTDPPYGMAYDSGWTGHKNIAGDSSTAVRDDALNAWGSRPAIVFGTWKMAKPSGVKQTLIWDKGDDPGMGDLKMPWGSYWEEMYVFGAGFVGRRSNGIIRCKTEPKGAHAASRPDHPTPKPVGLMERLIEKCPPGTIADPFAGSGATLMAAKNLRRKVIGVELEERYCEVIAKRCSQEVFDFGLSA